MNFECLKNNKGVTIAELVVAMGIVSLLLVFVVTGSLFVQNFLGTWKQRNRLTEELSYIGRELIPQVEQSKVIIIAKDSVSFSSHSGTVRVYRLSKSNLYRNNKKLNRDGQYITNLQLHRIRLPNMTDTTILPKANDRTPSGLYQLQIVVTDSLNHTDTLKTVVKNRYEYFKYSSD